jgi:hypothetical protein
LYLMEKSDIETKLSSRRLAKQNSNFSAQNVSKTSAEPVYSSNSTATTTTVLDGGDEDVDSTDNSDEQQDGEDINPTESSVKKTTVTTDTTVVTGSSDDDSDDTDVNDPTEAPVDELTAPSNGTRTGAPSESGLNTKIPVNSNATNTTEEEEVSEVYYQYNSPAVDSRKKANYEDHHSGLSTELKRLPIVVHSDFSSHQERLVPVNMMKHKTSIDIYTTTLGNTHALMTLRGQLWVAPVVDYGDITRYKGGGMNMPPRRYRVAPGAMMGGLVRILAVRHVPNPVEDGDSDRRLALILATDPLTDTAEHAFYLIETQAGVTPTFLDADHLPKPFLGGHVGGGRTFDGGLGSVKPHTLALSPCGRRMTWSDTDGRIMVMNMPQYQDMTGLEKAHFEVLPNKNELGEPMIGDEVDLRFSPGGRYLAVEHNARNQFRVISIVDLGDPEGEDKVADIQIGRIVQGTPSRFNSVGAYWGRSSKAVSDYQRDATLSSVLGTPEPKDLETTLYFLSDRDIQTDVLSPWGTRQPMPHFKSNFAVFALPLSPVDSDGAGEFTGGGASELLVQEELDRQGMIQSLLSLTKGRKLRETTHPLSGVFGVAEESFSQWRGEGSRLKESTEGTQTLRSAEFPSDLSINFGSPDLTFARKAYRVANIPEGDYIDIICQTPDAAALVLVEELDDQSVLTVFKSDPFPSDSFGALRFMPSGRKLEYYGLSSSHDHFYLGFGPDGAHVVVPNSVAGISKLFLDDSLDENVVDVDGIHLSIWPALEYRQMYDDAWR